MAQGWSHESFLGRDSSDVYKSKDFLLSILFIYIANIVPLAVSPIHEPNHMIPCNFASKRMFPHPQTYLIPLPFNFSGGIKPLQD